MKNLQILAFTSIFLFALFISCEKKCAGKCHKQKECHKTEVKKETAEQQ